MDIPGLIRSLGAKGLCADDIADAVAAVLGPVPVYDLGEKANKEAERKRKNAERMAAYRKARREAVATECADVAVTPESDVAVTVSEQDEHTSRERAPTCAQVVNPSSSLRSEENPPQEPLVLSPPEKPSGRKRTRSGRAATRRCPEDWEPNERHRELAVSLGFTAAMGSMALESFRDHEFRTAHSDWDAAFRNWLRNDFKRNGNGKQNQRTSVVGERRAATIDAMAAGAQAALDRRRGRWGSL